MSSLIYLYSANVMKTDTLVTIYLPVVILDFIAVFWIQPKLTLYNMYCDYTSMLESEHFPQKASRKLFTTDWINDFKRNGFIISQDHQTYTLLYQYYKKLDGISGAKDVLVFIVVAKQNSLDFYSDEIDQGIQAVYMNNESFQNITKQITLQFKQFDKYNQQAKDEVESAILFRSGRQRLINLTIGYVTDTQMIYTICPIRRFPNKYVFYACQEISKYAYLKE